MLALDFAQINRDPALKRGIDPVQVMFQQDIFGRNGGVGFQLEPPMSIGRLAPLQGGRGIGDRVLKT